MKKLSISIVIPAYNVEDYIEESLDSVFNQTESFYEVIVVDDGSYDGTSEIIEKYKGKYNLEHVRIENSGQGNARNVGMLAASGEYIYFFDSDDILDEEFVEEITKKLEEMELPDVLFFSGRCFSTPGFSTDFRPNYIRGFEAEKVSGEEVLRLFSDSGRFSSQPCLYISKRSFLIDNNLSFKHSSYEDEEFLFPMTLAAKHVCVWDKIFFHRRVRPMSFMTTPKDEKKAHGCYVIMLSLVDLYFQRDDWLPLTRKLIIKRAESFALRYVNISKSLGLKVDLKSIMMCSLKLRSPSLFLKSVFGDQNKKIHNLMRFFLCRQSGS